MIDVRKETGSEITFEAKIEFLKRSDSYPDRPLRVEAIETHMSWVFLSARHAYKLKKPVWYPYLDFRTLEARRLDCHEEVRINRELAGSVYLGVEPVCADSSGRIHLGGSGKPVEWLVKMRRLPMKRMLDQVLQNGTLLPEDLVRVAQLIVAFYQKRPRLHLSATQYCRRFRAGIEDVLRSLTRAKGASCLDEAADICSAQLRFLQREPESLGSRARLGLIRECHGDLRPEHICLEAEPVIIDALEFNRDLRTLDPADELSFLTLELERLGAPPFAGKILFDHYTRTTGDAPDFRLIHFYKSYRACVRAKLSFGHLIDPQVSDSAKWISRTQEYLRFAGRHIREATASV